MEQGTLRLKTGLAEMLKGGVIMDVTTPEQAKIAQDAGACAAMALGTAVCYAFGTVWFMAVTRMGLWESLAYCVFPFLAGDAVKIALATTLTRRLALPLRAIGWEIH